MHKYFRLFFTLSIMAIFNGCAHSSRVDHAANNQFVTEFYAWVDDVETIRFKSNASKGAAVGAVDGFLSNVHGNREQMLGGAIIGGLLGGLITTLFEGDNRGYEYQLSAVDGDLVSVIVDKMRAEQGQCVLVRVAGDVRLSPKPDLLCYDASKEYSN